MERRKKFYVIGCVLLLACVALAQRGSNPRFSNLQIHVQVRYPNGASASRGIEVVVERQGGGVVADGQTDTQGKASFTVSPPDFYSIRINQPGFETPAAQVVDLNTANSAYVIFDLKPVSGSTTLPPEGPGGEVKANQIPEEALKEFKRGQKLLLEEQKSDESLSHFQKAIKLHDNFPLAYVLLGMAYLDQRKSGEAQSVLEKAIQLDPNSAAAHLELGAAFNQQKKYPEAESELKRGLDLNPDAAEGRYEIAKTYWAMGNVEQSEAYATKAAQLRSDLPAVHVLLGNIALRKHDPQGALKEFNEYLRLDPKGPMAEPVHEMVKKIEKSTASK
ncbi:MAG TPA: tetratricopeptide repeat protein [Clostridia bacterium]|nr:tetratricopeptide repeat protein [Clostridia bacterium]